MFCGVFFGFLCFLFGWFCLPSLCSQREHCCCSKEGDELVERPVHFAAPSKWGTFAFTASNVCQNCSHWPRPKPQVRDTLQHVSSAGNLQNGLLDSQPCLALFFVQRFAGWLLGGYGSFCVERSIKFSSNVARVTVIGTLNHSFSSLIPSQSLVTLPLPFLCDGYDSSEA